MSKIVMGMTFADNAIPDFGSLYAVKINGAPDTLGVNDYGSDDITDVSKLDLITNAAPGSTCLFSNGDIYRLELSGWTKFGEPAQAMSSTRQSMAMVFSSPDIDRTVLAELSEPEEELSR